MNKNPPDIKQLFDDIDAKFQDALMTIPDTKETTQITISIAIGLANTLIKHQPQKLKEYWAEYLYKTADQLIAPTPKDKSNDL